MTSSPRLPDFIIGGPPKCATTTLHRLLALHPDVGIPIDEPHYFDADDPVPHWDYFHIRRGELMTYDPGSFAGPLFDGYAAQFAPFADRRLVGEDSTNYFVSEAAPARIARHLPDAKFIFLLRNPVERTYSQYWHFVATLRMTMSFERALREWPLLTIGSSYVGPIQRYRALFDPARIKILIFEDFVRDPQAGLDEVCDFLGLSRITVAAGKGENRTHYPILPAATLAMNRIGRHFARGRFINHLGARPEEGIWRERAYYYWKRLTYLGLREGRAPPMRESTRAFLTRHLSDRNHGLSTLLGKNLSDLWPGFRG